MIPSRLPSRHRAPRAWMKWTGMGLVIAGLVMFGRIGYFYVHSNVAGHALIRHEHTAMRTPPTHQLISWPPADVPRTTALGLVEIPSIGVKAPVIQGTQMAQLDVAVGHLSSSVYPGQLGTSVLAGHNVTWFHRINKIPIGADIRYVTPHGTWIFQVVRHGVVTSGSAVGNSAQPTVMLEACYPLDALYFTPYRYLVFAKLIRSEPTLSSQTPAAPSQHYTAAIPAVIRRQGLSLKENYAPMGTLTVLGHPATSWRASDNPLDLADVITTDYFALLHVAAMHSAALWQQMAPAVPWQDVAALSQDGVKGYAQSLDESETVSGHTVTAAAVKTELQLANGQTADVAIWWTVKNNQLIWKRVQIIPSTG
ncbi:MAG: class D sortase [Firmicutes bacterium]|nr:class D sortase [Bacillota bacterium]